MTGRNTLDIEVTGLRRHRPVTVARATLLWFIAVGAGVLETALVVTEFASAGPLGVGIWFNVAVRVLLYAGAALVVANFARGRRWARWCLLGLLSVVGLAAMVVPPAMLMAGGTSFVQAFTTTGVLSVPFLVVRAVHIAAVVVATVLMFTTSANRYFTPSRGSV